MKPIILLCFAVAMMVWSDQAIAGPCASDDNVIKSNGVCWNSMGQLEKSAIIRGIWEGKKISKIAVNLSTNKVGSFYFSFDHMSIPPSTNIGDISKYFDKLYSFPVNREIKWRHAYLLASIFARDDDSNDRLSLLTFLRDHDEIPYSGSLVDVIGPSTVVIKSGNDRHEVSIFGLSSKGLSKDHAEKATRFLKGLRLSSYQKDCKETIDTPVSLSYPQELFDNSGRLHPVISINNWAYICTRKGGISVKDLMFKRYKNASSIPLRYILLTYGLGEFRNEIDPKWSTARKRYLKYFGKSDDKNINNYYHLGGEKSDLIELISGEDVSTY